MKQLIALGLAAAAVLALSGTVSAHGWYEHHRLRAEARRDARLAMRDAQRSMHEARHIEVGNHRCGNNDFQPEDLEAFGVHYYFLLWTARHTDAATFPPEYRPYLEWSTCLMRNSAFCNGSCGVK